MGIRFLKLSFELPLFFVQSSALAMKGSSADQTLSIVTAKCYPSSAHIAVSVQISFTVSIIPGHVPNYTTHFDGDSCGGVFNRGWDSSAYRLTFG